MKRLLCSFCVLFSLGIASAAAALPSAARGAKVTHRTCNVAGTWRGRGVDVAHTIWRFELTLTQTDSAVAGAFDWHGSDGHDGRERVTGQVDCDAQRLTLRGVALENAPALALAQYVLALSPSSSEFAGRWSGGVPGTLRATRVATP